MKPLIPQRSIAKFLLSTPKATPPCVDIHHFSTTAGGSPLYPPRRHEEESRNVRVSVWWDFENCNLPANANVFKVAHFITAAVRANGIKGPLTITAFGDVLQLSRTNQEALSATGINLTHIPNGGKNSADRSLLVDLMYWVSQNPPPAHLFLISGDRDFASVLHRLRMNNYNILLASSDSAPGILCSSASIMWQWSALVRGDNLIGKYFNQPPDGPYASWYGHYKISLEDPFAPVGKPSNIKADEVSECGSDMFRPIPKIVLKQIRNILNSYPKGVSSVDLRSELGRNNVSIDKDFFGYRKFSRFLLAMPQILKIKSDTNGQYLVHGIPTKINGENDSITRSSVGTLATKDEGQSSSDAVKQNGQKSSFKESAIVKPSQRSVSETKVSGDPTKPPGPMKVHELPKPYTEGESGKLSPPLSKQQMVTEGASEKQSPPLSKPKIVTITKMQDSRKLLEPNEDTQETASVVREADKKKVTNSDLLVTNAHSSVSELSFFQKIFKWWFGNENGIYNAKVSTVVNSTLGPVSKTKQKKDIKVSDHGTGPAITNAATANQFSDNSKATRDVSTQPSSLLNKITNWFSSLRSLEESDDGSSKKSQNPDSSSHKLFSQDSFWNDIKAFLDTPKGACLVFQAKTRSQMGQALQRDGPPALVSLSGDDLLQLVDMLISDKKWVEESAFLSSPFKLVESVSKDAHGNGAHSSSVSGSVVSGMQSQSGSLKKHQLGEEKKCHNLPYSGVTQPASQKLNAKSKSEVLADCKNLVQFIVKEHPEGLNIGLFRKLFHEKFGYHLDLHKLGYTKLATLLQIMPGVNIELSHIMPSDNGLDTSAQEDHVVPSDKLSDEPQKDEENESPWDELGPLAATVVDEKTSNSKEAKKKMKGQVQHRYEPVSDNDSSDSSDSETTLSANIKKGEQRRGSEGADSLYKILGAWHKSQDGSIRKSNLESGYSSDESVENGKPAACRPRKLGEPDMSSFGRQKKPVKSYSFVADEKVNKKNEQLIDDVFGCLNKSGEK